MSGPWHDHLSPGVLPGIPHQELRLSGGPREGRILSVDTSAHTARFAVPDFAPDQTFGPAPYTVGAATAPQVGDACVVLFVGVGIERAWIVGWWR